MQGFYSTRVTLPLPEGHRFPIEKYERLRARLAAELPALQQVPAEPASDEMLALVHSAHYIGAVSQGTLTAAAQREIGFPWSEAMVDRARRSVGATVAAVRAALSDGVAANLAGGTHHASADSGGGFCVFNDVAVAARVFQADARRRQPSAPTARVAVIDLDVHQGNGTASIFADDACVFTLSVHGDKNFPFRKVAGDLDVGLPDGTGDADYLRALDEALAQLAQRFDPQLVIYLAGADAHEGDRLGRLKLTDRGMQARDERVFDWAWRRRLPVALCMGGGYGHDLATTVQVQMHTFGVALAALRRWQNGAR
ncbi:histone deacetylase family protein [Ottowia oryzae]|uniref:Histone deacetylase n=1 Tax=Ottowia oryzae TaxID=2109914 RepID=A0A2S0MJR9_9BURK|nr:histone deacetylase [Ottowia oryzae]AVO36138.1 histone deacetylase [Ottowia oryzae]